MTNETRSTNSGAAWVGIIAALAAAAVLWGMNGNGNVEVFGFDVPVILVGLVLWFLGFLGGLFNRRRQG